MAYGNIRGSSFDAGSDGGISGIDIRQQPAAPDQRREPAGAGRDLADSRRRSLNPCIMSPYYSPTSGSTGKNSGAGGRFSPISSRNGVGYGSVVNRRKPPIYNLWFHPHNPLGPPALPVWLGSTSAGHPCECHLSSGADRLTLVLLFFATVGALIVGAGVGGVDQLEHAMDRPS